MKVNNKILLFFGIALSFVICALLIIGILGDRQQDDYSEKIIELKKTCRSFYDGCNTCSLSEDGNMHLCTFAGCNNKSEPYCIE